MNIIRTHIRIVLTLCELCFLGSLACCSKNTLVSSEEGQIAEMVANRFVQDWGMPEHPDMIPAKCYLVERYYSPDNFDLESIRKQFPDAGKAIDDLLRKPTNVPIPEFSLPCERTSKEFNADDDPWNIHSGTGSPREFGIMKISRIGIDKESNIAVAVIGESRGDLAGSAWAIIMHRENGQWNIFYRKMILVS